MKYSHSGGRKSHDVRFSSLGNCFLRNNRISFGIFNLLIDISIIDSLVGYLFKENLKAENYE